MTADRFLLWGSRCLLALACVLGIATAAAQVLR